MEYLAYSQMFIAQEEASRNTKYNSSKSQLDNKKPLTSFDIVINKEETFGITKAKFNWKKLLKSSAWLALAGVGVLLIAAAQIQISTAAFVRTNGSCLRIRTGPSTNYSYVDCLPNGTTLPAIERYENGFARLSTGRYVFARWVGNRPNYAPITRPGGVGGSVILTPGSRGQLVRDVQTALGNLRVDGIYGRETVNRVRSFQASKGLLVDGTVGPETRGALGI
ncbi:peptidoglycan binding domain-containing protein [Nostoc commune NIES-4072]|uniref:Peptidoglycan binding domain-containing protein n=1 Tax=Nostoc commune NIES-4072 TaxID=2005467 RepID=A0A2R5FFG0_NOSCO|nr:peptidoglycan-binding protein [Nostoc commune]BBD66186.1 peptidoglycan binding domain-containing protein [Nostoc commune HK-02]GBG16489.1 peptidoglycan binding domain-containing protein [Nostoc commune NIES-4072]